MVQGADSGVDAAIFLGYHARAGSLHAVLDHTWSSVRVANLWLNGRITGEFGLNGAICGELGIPVIMVSGDQTVCAEAREWAPGVAAAQVKTAAGRYAAHCLPFEISRKLIEDTAREAVISFKAKKHPAPIKVKPPVTVTIEFFHSHMADQASAAAGCLPPGWPPHRVQSRLNGGCLSRLPRCGEYGYSLRVVFPGFSR